MRWFTLSSALLLSAGLAACSAIAPVNAPLKQMQVNSPLSIFPHIKAGLKYGKDPDTLLILAFSGGGTRAAAFSYGVLEELKRTIVHSNGKAHPLSQDISVIGGVSGGGFTALAYSLYGDKLFDTYDQAFLKRNVQGNIVKQVFNPKNWSKLSSSKYGRAELAAEYYDRILFHDATFGDLLKDPNAPMPSVSASELATGTRFTFTQDDFNVICSDLSKMKLSRAAAATSAVPSVFSPVALHNYAGKCDYKYPDWAQHIVKQDPADRPITHAALEVRDIETFQDRQERPFLHFVDGGITDNLGLKSILAGLYHYSEGDNIHAELGELPKPKRIVVIAVNAMTAHPNDLDKKESAPGMLTQLLRSSSVPMDHYSTQSLAQLNDLVDLWGKERALKVAQLRESGLSQEQAEKQLPTTKLFAIDVSFLRVKDAQERVHLLDLPTSFTLPEADVELLKRTAATLLRESPVYKKLLVELNAL